MPDLIREGPYAGWLHWEDDTHDGRFVDRAIGPFLFRANDLGDVECWAPEVGRQHTNGGDALHGGYLMSVADMAYYAIASRGVGDVFAVTLTATFEFLGAGLPDGGGITATGQVLKETGKLIFVRCILYQNGAPILSSAATLRKLKFPAVGDAR
jgi:acyl-coenzyme A thioesterase PaaI-like protein